MPRKMHANKPCTECPWRTDQPPGRFPPERYRKLEHTVQEGGFGYPMFGCHKSPEGGEFACAGYLLVDGWRNNTVRFNTKVGAIDLTVVGNPDKLELWNSYEEMAYFNGWDCANQKFVEPGTPLPTHEENNE
jgi:Family of unknown function (DUF6283)